MSDLFPNSIKLNEPHYHTAVTSGDDVIWDLRTRDGISAAEVVAIIYNIANPDLEVERIYLNTIETMVDLEPTGEYIVTTVSDTLDGVQATVVRCYQRCVPSPSMN